MQKFNSFAVKIVLISVVLTLLLGGGVTVICGQQQSIPLDWTQVMKGLLTKGQTKETSTLESREKYMMQVILKRGLSFEFTDDAENLLRKVGAGEALINTLKKAKKYSPKKIINPITAEDYFKASLECEDGQFECQIDYLTKALRINPQYADAYGRRGTIYFVMNQTDLASKDYLKTIELSPNFAFNRLMYGMFLIDRKDYTRAIREFTKAIEINQRYAEAYYFRGVSYEFQLDFKKAFADFNEAIKYDSTNAESYIKRGKLYAQDYKYQPAISDFTKAIQLDPKNAESYKERSKAFESIGEIKKAADDKKMAERLQ